jgi:hypothetical protein
MNIIVDKPQLVRVVLLYLNMNFGNLTPKSDSEYPDLVFYVDSNNEVMMEYNNYFDEIHIHYERIWSKIESLFQLNHDNTELIMKHWLEETYDLRNLRHIQRIYSWNFNLRGFTI